MNKLEQYASQMGMVMDRCDGGRKYPWRQAAKDMEDLLCNIKRYSPRSRGNRLIRLLLIKEAELWISNWMREIL